MHNSQVIKNDLPSYLLPDKLSSQEKKFSRKPFIIESIKWQKLYLLSRSLHNHQNMTSNCYFSFFIYSKSKPINLNNFERMTGYRHRGYSASLKTKLLIPIEFEASPIVDAIQDHFLMIPREIGARSTEHDFLFDI